MAKSEYLQREEAAKKQLGAKGVKKRVKQLPTAARAFTREMTGIDISRKGVKVDPFAVAMALPVGKVLKAAKVLRAAGKIGKAASLEARAFAKTEGRAIRSQVEDLQGGGDFGPTMKWLRRERLLSENIFPKISKYTDGSMFNRYGDMLPKATRKARGIKRVNPQAD